jgi:hypothetical protein
MNEKLIGTLVLIAFVALLSWATWTSIAVNGKDWTDDE